MSENPEPRELVEAARSVRSVFAKANRPTIDTIIALVATGAVFVVGYRAAQRDIRDVADERLKPIVERQAEQQKQIDANAVALPAVVGTMNAMRTDLAVVQTIVVDLQQRSYRASGETPPPLPPPATPLPAIGPATH